MSKHYTEPATVAPRALAPDLARGAMLLPIAVANVMIYLHGRPYGLRQHVVPDEPADRLVTFLTVATVDGRAYPLFAALYGYGLVRIFDRTLHRATPDAARRLLRRRSLILILFGLLHAVAGFSGDVLGWYGLLGIVLAGFLRASDRTLLRVAVAALLVTSLLQGVVYSEPGIKPERSYLWSFAIADPVEALGWRLVEWPMTAAGLLAVVPAVLAGIWIARHGVLDAPAAHAGLLRRVAVAGILAGLAGGVGPGLIAVQAWSPSYPVTLGLACLHVLTGVLCGLGYLAALALLAERLAERHRTLPFPVRALQATGRRSLSCYLAQSVVFVGLLPAWSLGWGARLGSAQALLLAVGTWGATVLLAAWLERRGRRGPAELAVRTLLGREAVPAGTSGGAGHGTIP